MIKIWLICIFNLATKIVELWSEKHIFLSAVHSFYSMGLKFSYVSLFEVFLKIFKFGLFAYSIWLPKWPNYAPNSIFSCLPSKVYIPLVSNFHMYMYLYLRSPEKILKFSLFVYSIWLPKWPNDAWNSIFSCLQSTVFIVRVSNFHM